MESAALTDGPLSDIRVVELGEFIAAPYCGKLLADLGAEVIKVESPAGGDKARVHGPFPDDVPGPERSGLFLFLNTNKMGVTLDPYTSYGRGLLEELLGQADVLVHGLGPSMRRRLGLDPAALRQRFPRLVATGVTAFGQQGPYADYKGHALQAAASSLAYRLGDPDRHPLTLPLSEADFIGGLQGAAATLLALYARRLTGRGQEVDISTLECLSVNITSLPRVTAAAFGIGDDMKRNDYHGGSYPWVTLPCADGYVCILAGLRRHWERYVEVMGHPEWTQEPPIVAFDRKYMAAHADELDALQIAWLAGKTKKELLGLFDEHRIPNQPALNIDEVVESDHLSERGFFIEVEHPLMGRVKMPGPPFRLVPPSYRVRRSAPLLGQDNEAIFCHRLGHSRDELAQPEGTATVTKGQPAHGDGPYQDPSTFAEAGNPGVRGRTPSNSVRTLQGLRVIDFSQVWSGPLCATILADMGAEVIKVESKERMADGPLRPEYQGTEPLNLRCSNFVRNRLSIGLDITRPEGREVVRRLVQVSDIVVENFTPRVLLKFGLGYENLRELNPALIMISLSACGQTGPWRNRLTYGPTLTALYGMVSLLGYSDNPWPRADVSEADPIAGCFGVLGVMAALFDRQKTGRGQHVDLAQGEGLLSLAAEAVLEYTMNGRVLGIQDNRHRTMAPHGNYPCRGDDRWIAIAVETEEEWAHLCGVLGSPSWTREPRFQDMGSRLQVREELDELLSQETRRFEDYRLMHLLQEGGVAAFPVLDASGQMADPHLRHRRRLTKVDIATEPVEIPLGIPWHLSETPGSIRCPAGMIGSDSLHVLRDLLGVDDGEVERLVEQRAITVA